MKIYNKQELTMHDLDNLNVFGFLVLSWHLKIIVETRVVRKETFYTTLLIESSDRLRFYSLVK